MNESEEESGYVAPERQLYIRRKAAVRWFDLRQLLATAAKTIAATIVGPMSGRRELMAALDPLDGTNKNYVDLSQCGPELWLDYLADTGDGWNATTSVAWLLGRDALLLDREGQPTPQAIPPTQAELDLKASAEQILLPRGEVLIAGGDEVYPTASAKDYQRRLIRPFECARFSQDPPRQILAIPGNHDWYDGLTAFIRLFCQKFDARRWIGAWRTRQWRSYFAVKLPHGWWLWGIDVALGDDIDPPQLDYFRAMSKHLQADERVILCIPEPHWEMGRDGSENSEAMIHEMEDKLTIFQRLATHNKATGIKLILTGDLHYYAHYRSIARPASGKVADYNHYLVCGGGGAFGLGTICAPDGPVNVGADKAELMRGGLFPSRTDSARIRNGIWRFPLRNPGFTALLVAVQLIALWLVGALRPPEGGEVSWVTYAMSQAAKTQKLSLSNLSDFLWQVLRVLPYPALLAGTLAIFAGFI
ncbi:MAG: hypothetical protein LBE21_05895, partial [Pseudomonadales bacterium]|nr:hypothetical protein [Pseudomonadales bacterium]